MLIDVKKLSVIALAITLVSCSGQKKVSDSSDEALGSDAGKIASESDAKTLPSKFGMHAPDRVFFAYDSATLVSEAELAVEEQAKYVKHTKAKVTVEGYCDERGTAEYNMALGERRAHAVKHKLVASGVKKSDVKTVSYGKSKPAVLGDTEEAYAQNRRAVLIVE